MAGAAGHGSLFLKRRVFELLRAIREPALLAFSTASSEAAYPKTLDRLKRFGCSDRIASFVLPMGYSFNLDGSMMYCTFATIFIAQAYGIDLSLSQEITMLLILMVTSKGMAGVPRASLVVIAATLAQFNIPEAGCCCCWAWTTSWIWAVLPPTCWVTPLPPAWWPRAKTSWAPLSRSWTRTTISTRSRAATRNWNLHLPNRADALTLSAG